MVSRIEDTVEGGIKQVIPHHEQVGVFHGFRLMTPVQREMGRAPRQTIDRIQPAVDMPLQEILPAITQEGGQRSQSFRNQRLIIQTAPCKCRLPTQKPTQYAVACAGHSRGLVINAATIETVCHEEGITKAVAPERVCEQEGDAQVMGRVIVVLVVLVQGRGKPLAFPADSRQEVVGEGGKE